MWCRFADAERRGRQVVYSIPRRTPVAGRTIGFVTHRLEGEAVHLACSHAATNDSANTGLLMKWRCT